MGIFDIDFFRTLYFFALNGHVAQERKEFYFRGVAIYVPKPAQVCKGVRVLCDLSAENVSHSTPCAIDATEEDPARRLGIRVTFFNKLISFWTKTLHIPKVNHDVISGSRRRRIKIWKSSTLLDKTWNFKSWDSRYQG